jgi:hypothetical protein
VSERPYRYYQRLVDPKGRDPYVVLCHAHLRQSKIYAGTIEIWPIVKKWNAELCLDDDGVLDEDKRRRPYDALYHLAWALSIIGATDAKKMSTHPDVLAEKKLRTLHQGVDKAVTRSAPAVEEADRDLWRGYR